MCNAFIVLLEDDFSFNFLTFPFNIIVFPFVIFYLRVFYFVDKPPLVPNFILST